MNTEQPAPIPFRHSSQTRHINTEVVRIMVELSELVRDHEQFSDKPLLEKIAGRVREERLTERALIVNYLTLTLPDNAETRQAIEFVFGGSHRRMNAVVAGTEDAGRET